MVLFSNQPNIILQRSGNSRDRNDHKWTIDHSWKNDMNNNTAIIYWVVSGIRSVVPIINVTLGVSTTVFVVNNHIMYHA